MFTSNEQTKTPHRRLPLCLLALVVSGSAIAQDAVRNYRKPILMVETGGHHASVREIIWHDEQTLLTGGEDKVVKVWDLREGARLARSLRPPIWRGLAGSIYTMAASRPDANGQSFLAVAGFGVEDRRGDITVFRFPGADPARGPGNRIPSGDVVKRLLPPASNQPQGIGHRNAVLCLEFDPAGKLLASGGMDGQVILWDVPGFTPRKPLVHEDAQKRPVGVRALAFSPDGLRLATAGSDGSIRIWDVATSAIVDSLASRAAVPDALNTLAMSRDGRWLVAGSEGGRLWRIDLPRGLAAGIAALATQPAQGPVEKAVFSPDGARLAVSIKSDNADRLDPMTLACDVEVRSMPDGAVTRRDRVAGLIRGLAFNPAGNRLAYSGGPAQAVYLRDLANPQAQLVELKGQGSTPFDLGFTADSQAVGFSRIPVTADNPPVFEGFDLASRRTKNLPRNQVHGAVKTLAGWTLEGSIRNFVLEAKNQDGRSWRCDLDPDTERNWWSYTMIPAGPGHPRATVAVGCETGIVIYDLETGARTRVFAGHFSPIVSLAPSPDGRWLASGSIDQTIMLYALEGCDTRPGLGASFRQRPNRSWTVVEVDAKGFAAQIGLLPGDTLFWAGIGRGRQATTYDTPEKIDQFLDRAREVPPHLYGIAVRLKRTLALPPPVGIVEIELPMVGTYKRNNPVMTLMLGADKEWVLWAPQGFYDTSIDGDTRYLGWHINPDYRASRSTDFVPMSTYAGTMLQPKVLEQLWKTGDLEKAMVAAGLPAGAPTFDELAYKRQPPRITFAPVEGGALLPAPGILWTVDVPNPRLAFDISSTMASKIAGRRVIADERLLELPPLQSPSTQVRDVITLQLEPKRRVRLAVEATSQNQTRRSETIDLIYLPPKGVAPTPPARSRLIVVSIGNERTRDAKALPAVPFADKDARGLAQSLAAHLISRDGVKCEQNPATDRIILTGANASARGITEALDQLNQKLESHEVRRDDVVAVVINSHVLVFDDQTVITASDTEPAGKPLAQPSIPAQAVSDLLGRLADYGCRVWLFLDGVHNLPAGKLRSDIKPWVRDLQQNRRVVTFVASKENASDVSERTQQGVFAQGLLTALQGAGAAPDTLESFRRRMKTEILNLSERLQESEAYFPIEVDPRSLFSAQ